MDIGNTFHALEDYKTALEYCKKALEIEETAAGKNHPGTAWAYHIAGLIYSSLKDTVNALEYHRQALAIFEALGEECAEDAQKVRETIAQITAEAKQ
jgi:tetratricopeptide (TPR) repeat protein